MRGVALRALDPIAAQARETGQLAQDARTRAARRLHRRGAATSSRRVAAAHCMLTRDLELTA
jgi:hypothetical protein